MPSCASSSAFFWRWQLTRLGSLPQARHCDAKITGGGERLGAAAGWCCARDGSRWAKPAGQEAAGSAGLPSNLGLLSRTSLALAPARDAHGGGRLCPPLAPSPPLSKAQESRRPPRAPRPRRSAPLHPRHPGRHPAAPAGREAPPPVSPPPAPGLAARQHRPLPAAETHLHTGQGQGEDEREDHAEIHADFRPRRLRAHGRRAPGGKRFPQRAPRPPGLRHGGRRAFPCPLRAGLLGRELQEPSGEELVVRGDRSNSR